MLSTGQLILRILAHVDVLLFFTVFAGSAISERYICGAKPLSVSELLSFSDSFSSLFGPNGSEGFNYTAGSTIWDHRSSLLNQAQEYDAIFYHFLYISTWALLVAYFVSEIWLYCVLLKGINTRRTIFLYKWVSCRSFILALTFILILYHAMGSNVVTCTDLLVIPFSVFRLGQLLAIVLFISRIRLSASTENIVMK